MQLSNDLKGFRLLYETIIDYYKSSGARHVSIFSDKPPGESDPSYYVRFLLDRRHVIEYAVHLDRGYLVGGVSLGIGPSYFGPADFWTYENSERFLMEASVEGVRHNLMLLDEFLKHTG